MYWLKQNIISLLFISIFALSPFFTLSSKTDTNSDANNLIVAARDGRGDGGGGGGGHSMGVRGGRVDGNRGMQFNRSRGEGFGRFDRDRDDSFFLGWPYSGGYSYYNNDCYWVQDADGNWFYTCDSNYPYYDDNY